MAGLTNLRFLQLAQNEIADLSSLAGLKQLTALSLSDKPCLIVRSTTTPSNWKYLFLSFFFLN
ncbi:MAG: leucine-rich repeat domain-containing protein [Verrucomicrobiota bacterium]|nr:leucine-rich repeat domain-containing protein [Verrucomicrobiota bacterium]